MASRSTPSLTSQIARTRTTTPATGRPCESTTRPRTGTSSRTSRSAISPRLTMSPASTQAGANPGAATAIWALCQPVTPRQYEPSLAPLSSSKWNRPSASVDATRPFCRAAIGSFSLQRRSA